MKLKKVLDLTILTSIILCFCGFIDNKRSLPCGQIRISHELMQIIKQTEENNKSNDLMDVFYCRLNSNYACSIAGDSVTLDILQFSLIKTNNTFDLWIQINVCSQNTVTPLNITQSYYIEKINYDIIADEILDSLSCIILSKNPLYSELNKIKESISVSNNATLYAPDKNDGANNLINNSENILPHKTFQTQTNLTNPIIMHYPDNL